jgi:ATP-binding cassette ChvD family protein
MPDFIYSMKGLKKTTPDGRKILDGIWLSYFWGAKIGVIGPNGSGKSTLMRIMAGLDTEFDGETWMEPSVKVGYLEQEPELDPTLDVRGNIELGLASVRALLDRFDEVNNAFADPDLDADGMDALITEQGDLQDKIDAVEGWELDRMVEIAMDALRVPEPDADVTVLSGGERRRVALCRLLLEKPDLLLLDEPTNHLDADTVAWLERTLRDYEGTVIIVTHDRYFLDNVTKWILELEGGKGIPFEGNYSEWLQQKLGQYAKKGKDDTARSKALRDELDWVRLAQSARYEKNESRLRHYDQLMARNNDRASGKYEIAIPSGPRLGNIVVTIENLSKGFGDRLLIDDLTFDLPRSGIVGIIGPNGAGKTTLFKMILGQEQPDSGTITVGETVRIASVEQLRDSLDPKKSVWENISHGQDVLELDGRKFNSRAWVSAFGFKGASQQQAVGTLSGGERNRVHLAQVVKAGGNLLLLDEPTNDLDVGTLRALEDALTNYPGCAVIISHDRWFLDRVATHILAFEGDSQVVWFKGSYADYARDRRKRLGEDADNPKRIKYRPLTR